MGMRLLFCLVVVLVLPPVLVRGQIDEGYDPFESFNATDPAPQFNDKPDPELKPGSGESLWFSAKKEIRLELREKSWSLKSRAESDIKDLKAAMSKFEEHLELAKTYDRSMLDQLRGGRRTSGARLREQTTYNAMKEQLATLKKISGELETFREYDYVKPAWAKLSEDDRAKLIRERSLSAKERLALGILDYLQAPTEATIVNSANMQFVSVPAGYFTTIVNQYGRKRDFELTKSTRMAATEVTRKQYQQVMGEKDFPSDSKKTTLVDPPLHPELPAMVTWYEAVEFCQALSNSAEEKGEKRYYRLPTEVEWEHACRAGTATEFSFGDQAVLTGKEANMQYEETLASKHFRLSLNFDGLIPVGSFSPNSFGLYDMHGNAAEWCGDWYSKDYLATGPKTDPPGPKDCYVEQGGFNDGRFYFPTAILKIVRGGAYDTPVASCTSFASRINEYQSGKFGFRVVCEIGVPSEITKQQYAELQNFKEDRLQPALFQAYRDSLAMFREQWELFNSTEVPKGEEWLNKARLPENRAEFGYQFFKSLQFVYGFMDAEDQRLRTLAEKMKYTQAYLDQELRNDGGYTRYSLGLRREMAYDYVSLKQFDKANAILSELLTKFPKDEDVISLKKHIEDKMSK